MTNIVREQQGSIAIVTLNRPERRNALSVAMMAELRDVVRKIGGDDATRAVILAASGSVFCSGHDLGEMTGRSVGEYRGIFDLCTELMELIQEIRQPVVAEVQGPATAAGCQLVATCDLVLAADSATFATPGVKIGLFCTTPMVALTRAIGRKRAMQMLLTGAPIDAKTAAEWGLVNSVVPKDVLRQASLELTQKIAVASPMTVALGKQAFYSQIDLDQPKAYGYAKEVMSLNAMAGDAQEGMTAFLEKRTPCWSGN